MTGVLVSKWLKAAMLAFSRLDPVGAAYRRPRYGAQTFTSGKPINLKMT